MNNKVESIFDSIKKLTSLELNLLVNLVESEFKILDNINSNGDVSSKQNLIETSEEKKTYDLVVESILADKKISVLKIVKNTLNLGLRESKEFIDNLPKLFKQFNSKEEALEIKKQLEEAGAVIVLK